MSNNQFYKHIAEALNHPFNRHEFDSVCPKLDNHDIASPLISHEEFESILNQLDAGNSYE